MPSIGDNLSDDKKESLLHKSIEQGDVFYIELNAKDGITPKNGYSSRYKFFVVLGFDESGIIYGGIVINSKLNENLSSEIKDYQYKIKHENHPFLKKGSFVNCSKIISIPKSRLLKSEYKGSINKCDLGYIAGAVASCPMIPKKYKKRFDLI